MIMDYKEKLKAIINSKKTPFVDINTFLKYFPELAESDDERIRKEIVEYIKIQQRVIKDEGHIQQANDIEKWLVWLKKQGEQKEIDYNEELKKCKDNPLYFFNKYVTVKLKEQNHTWSEEDERHRKRIVERLEDIRKPKEDNIDVASVILSEINWLKSLRMDKISTDSCI